MNNYQDSSKTNTATQTNFRDITFILDGTVLGKITSASVALTRPTEYYYGSGYNPIGIAVGNASAETTIKVHRSDIREFKLVRNIQTMLDLPSVSGIIHCNNPFVNQTGEIVTMYNCIFESDMFKAETGGIVEPEDYKFKFVGYEWKVIPAIAA